jgi:hypothetical protein
MHGKADLRLPAIALPTSPLAPPQRGRDSRPPKIFKKGVNHPFTPALYAYEPPAGSHKLIKLLREHSHE